MPSICVAHAEPCQKWLPSGVHQLSTYLLQLGQEQRTQDDQISHHSH